MRTNAVSRILFGAATGEASSATSSFSETAHDHPTEIGRHKTELQKKNRPMFSEH